ncbi:hypothetical protein MES5069_770067 [Mesorhizobium escarrei]|uniref:Uncharacterized protein n=1 Tax=Mesorhizobium escarrei TaxID=666018 RepID=A0ABN8KG52_9HYPH|nr:hypothetical protein MES5069_770067 [Mesorhizobium escarrei]
MGEGGLARSAKTEEGCWKKRSEKNIKRFEALTSPTQRFFRHPSSDRASLGHLGEKGRRDLALHAVSGTR